MKGSTKLYFCDCSEKRAEFSLSFVTNDFAKIWFTENATRLSGPKINVAKQDDLYIVICTVFKTENFPLHWSKDFFVHEISNTLISQHKVCNYTATKKQWVDTKFKGWTFCCFVNLDSCDSVNIKKLTKIWFRESATRLNRLQIHVCKSRWLVNRNSPMDLHGLAFKNIKFFLLWSKVFCLLNIQHLNITTESV